MTAPHCLGSPSSARSMPAASGAPGGCSTAVTLCGTVATLGKPLSQLVVFLKVQGPAQLSVTWWKRRHRSPAAEGGCPEQEAWLQQKPSGECLQHDVLLALAFCCGGFFGLNNNTQMQRALLLVPNVAWDWAQQRGRVKPVRSLQGRAWRLLLLA